MSMDESSRNQPPIMGSDLDVERGSDVPISTQIYWQLAYQIDSGRLLPGSRLPPVRELGAALRVNPNTIRASLGTIFAVPCGSALAAEVLAWLRLHEVRIVAARPGAALLATEADLRGRIAIVVGAEAEGLGEAWNEPDIEAVGLPMLGVADSLNVAAASAVLLYEARRQRGLPPKAGAGPR